MNFSSLSIPQRISAISIIVVALAAFLPWASLFGFTAYGIAGDGIITLILALAGGVVFVLTSGLIGKAKPAKASQIALVVLAILVALVGAFHLGGLAAIGVYLTFFAGVAWTVGAVWELMDANNRVPATGQIEPDASPPAGTTPPQSS